MLVQLFKSDTLNVSLIPIVCDDSEIYFKAREVAMALGYSNPNGAIQKHVSEKYKLEYYEIQGAQIDDDDKLYLTTLTLSAKAGFHNGRVKY